jgi:hypothetical protein
MTWINFAACMVLLVYLLAAGMASHKWRNRLSICLLVWAVTFQMIDPLFEWIPSLAWPGVFFNVALAAVTTMWRKPLWRMVRERFA